VKVQKISAEDTIDLRQRILRPGQPIEVCHYREDHFPTTFHLGITIKEKVVCNGTFIQQNHELFLNATKPYRLRGMATDFEFQKKGLGALLFKTALHELQAIHSDLLWFNARTSAEKFYISLGFEATGPQFDIEGAGPHRVMFKWLQC
jgi:predicted GNAT family N-acyltransferase